MNTGILIQGAVGNALTWIGQMMALFTTEPMIYFVGVGLVGAVAGVARKFVPMRRG